MVSRRTFNTSPNQKEFTHFRTCPLEEFSSGLLITALDSLLIYDSTKNNLEIFVQALFYTDNALYQRYFSQYNLFEMTVKQFDSSTEYFLRYFKDLSLRVCSYLGIDLSRPEAIGPLLQFYSDRLRLPLAVSMESTNIELINVSSMRIAPVFITIQNEKAWFFYPCLTQETNLRSIYHKNCNQCQTSLDFNQKDSFQIGICLLCAINKEQHEKTISFSEGAGNSFDVQKEETKNSDERNEQETPKQSSNWKTKCKKCQRYADKEFFYYCQKGCCVCNICWVSEYDQNELMSCPLCKVFLDAGIYKNIYHKLKLAHREVLNEYEKTERCVKCSKMSRKSIACQRGCSICYLCWINSEKGRSYFECGKCGVLLNCSVKRKLKREFKIAVEENPTINSLCNNCKQRCEDGIPEPCECRICVRCWENNKSGFFFDQYNCPSCRTVINSQQNEYLKRYIRKYYERQAQRQLTFSGFHAIPAIPACTAFSAPFTFSGCPISSPLQGFNTTTTVPGSHGFHETPTTRPYRTPLTPRAYQGPPRHPNFYWHG